MDADGSVSRAPARPREPRRYPRMAHSVAERETMAASGAREGTYPRIQRSPQPASRVGDRSYSVTEDNQWHGTPPRSSSGPGVGFFVPSRLRQCPAVFWFRPRKLIRRSHEALAQPEQSNRRQHNLSITRVGTSARGLALCLLARPFFSGLVARHRHLL